METKKTIYIIISVFFLASVFLVMFVISPLWKELAQKSGELVSQRDSRIILDSQFSEVEKFKQIYDSYKPNLDKIDNLFVDSQNPVDFIEYLEKTGTDAGAVLKISTPSLSKEKSLSYENFQFSSSGSFSGTLKFLRELESGPYMVQIKSINIGTTKNSPDQKQATGVGSNISIKVLAK